MRQGIRYAALIALVVALGGPACTTARPPGPAQGAQTSYPSPDYPADYPAQAQPGETAVAAPAKAATPKLAERPLATPPPAAARPAPAAPAPAAPPAARQPGSQTRDQAGRFAAMDADHNGRITLEEWRNFQEREFRRLDVNDDGVITREEMAGPGRNTAAPAARPRP